MSEAPHRNAVQLFGRVHHAPTDGGAVVVVWLATPDGDRRDVHRVECSGKLADVARTLDDGDMVDARGSLHHYSGPRDRVFGAYIRARRIERVHRASELPELDPLE